MEDKPRTDLGQAEDGKDLRRAAYRGKVQFYQKFSAHYPLSHCHLSKICERRQSLPIP